MKTIGIIFLSCVSGLICTAGHADEIATQDWKRDQAAMLEGRKKECGEAYARPQIGMTLKRAQYCAGVFPMTLYSKSATATGKMSTYRWGRHLIDVENDVITAITAYKNIVR